jgi:purine-cytosine permease-like protein
VQAADLGPIPPGERRQSALDLFLIFAGANIVATTLQVGATLTPAYDVRTAIALIVAGSLAGAAIVAALAPIGPRLGVPSVVAARAALGTRGAALIAVLLFGGNFAWIAINNVIAASACAPLFGGLLSARGWAVLLGLVATIVVVNGPRVVGLADRLAVPLLAVLGVSLTIACLRAYPAAVPVAAASLPWLRGLDVVIGYQVSWLLMFADYSRYTASPAKSAGAVFLGLALTSIWLMPLGAIAAQAASSHDPGAMLRAVGLGASGAALLALATLTTNFVNIYLSSLAWKSLVPSSPDRPTVWAIGLIGAALSLLSEAWISRYADLMLVIGGVLVPVGGVLFARFYLDRKPIDVRELYEGPRTISRSGLVAWAAGGAAYYATTAAGSTLPSLVVAAAVYRACRMFDGSS